MRLADEAATIAAGRAVGAMLQVGDVIFLRGDLGAGKTCMARGLLSALGFGGEVPSPSFPIVIPYEGAEMRLPVWHVDLYRLDDPAQVDELGLDDVLTDGALVIEWPERAGSDRFSSPLIIHLNLTPDGARSLTADAPPSWKDRWPF